MFIMAGEPNWSDHKPDMQELQGLVAWKVRVMHCMCIYWCARLNLKLNEKIAEKDAGKEMNTVSRHFLLNSDNHLPQITGW